MQTGGAQNAAAVNTAGMVQQVQGAPDAGGAVAVKPPPGVSSRQCQPREVEKGSDDSISKSQGLAEESGDCGQLGPCGGKLRGVICTYVQHIELKSLSLIPTERKGDQM